MDFFTSRYFRINKLFLSIVGLWPYHTSSVKYLILSLSALGPTITLLPQVIYFVKHSNNVDEVFAVMPIMIAAIINLMKVVCLVYNSEKFKLLLQLTHDWNNLPKNQEAQLIVTRYAEMGRKFTLVYSYAIFVVIQCYALMLVVAPVLDLILPLNETRPRKLLFPADYLVSQEKYYHTIALCEYIGFCVCAIIATATDTTYFLLLGHIYGMLTVLCYRLENLKAHDKLEWDSNNQLCRSNRMEIHVRECIDLDKEIRIYINIMKSVFETFVLVDIALGVVVNTCTCIMIVIRAEQLSEIMRYVIFVAMQTFRLFLFNWSAQEVTDHSSGIPIAAYYTEWYLMPRKVQKMIMMLITRSQRPSQMILAGIYIMNLENFSAIMKTSVSYCTVMISLRGTTENV